MLLFRHETHNELVVIGEKSIYNNIKLGMADRGYEYLGGFNSSWGAFTKEFVQLSTRKEYEEFINRRPFTDAYELKAVRSKLNHLTIQFQKLQHDLGE